jgi:hypothetical protein
MTYDSTLMQTLAEPGEPETLPACLTRNNLSPQWFPASTRSQVAMVAVLCTLFAWTSLHRLNHTDLWGHLHFGRWMVEHQSLPGIDPFSAEPVDRPLVPNAWLAQVVGYQTLRCFGLEGLALGHALLATLASGLMIAAIYRRGAPLCWAVAGGAAFYLLQLPIVGTIRPQLFGMVGAAGAAGVCGPAGKAPPAVVAPVGFSVLGQFAWVVCVGVGDSGPLLRRRYVARDRRARLCDQGDF